MPFGDQLISESDVIVDFAIVGNPNRAILVAQRLMSQRDVNDAQASVPEGDMTIDIKTAVIRTSMDQGLIHRVDPSGIDSFIPVIIENAVNPAHVFYRLCPYPGTGAEHFA